ncbi:MAG: 2-amino-4-hydroxy-6-hydroxymethyldihydropteridine diphosphokinase [Lachnospiraceae bacterium]|nr:2-amino-4-hydroxy-6-hydroxymethyldihydropteridine diphosphokinase [Lachnospiraceae bacterium]
MDHIRIEQLKVFAYHGVREHEKRDGQFFFVDVDLGMELRPAGLADDLEKTVNYSGVCTFISDYVSATRYDLIEALAEHLATELLVRYALIREVTVTIHKPNAPVKEEFKNISVNITRKWNRVYLGIGSNIGDRRQYIEDALCKLKTEESIRDVICSSLIETKPYGGVEQEDFLNGVVYIKTFLPPHDLLDLLHRIENEAGRTREVHWGPRTLDIDILFYEDLLLCDPDLSIPHPDLSNREFVLRPMLEIAPYYVNPLTGRTVSEMCRELGEREKARNKGAE